MCSRWLAQYVTERGINVLFLIGGDGTHRGAIYLSKLLRERGRVVAVAGIPKTIDNDVAVVDLSFGFRTAVEHAVAAIISAKTEAKCLRNGIGMVKLMGRHAGFIACFASIASGAVDLCLLPELPITLEGRNNHLDHLRRVLAYRGHAVVVLAEGAGEDLLGARCVSRSWHRCAPPPPAPAFANFIRSIQQIRKQAAKMGRRGGVRRAARVVVVGMVVPTRRKLLSSTVCPFSRARGRVVVVAGVVVVVASQCNGRCGRQPQAAGARPFPQGQDQRVSETRNAWTGSEHALTPSPHSRFDSFIRSFVPRHPFRACFHVCLPSFLPSVFLLFLPFLPLFIHAFVHPCIR